MGRMAVLMPSLPGSPAIVHPDYADEYAACSASDYFFPVLYNELEYLWAGEKLAIANPAPVKSQYCIMRGEPLSWMFNDELSHVLRRSGYYRALGNFGVFGPTHKPAPSGMNECLYPRQVQPYNKYEDHWKPGSYRWFPSIDVIRTALPAIAKNGRRVLRGVDGKPKVFLDIDYDVVNAVVAEFHDEPIPSWESRAPVWFEEYLRIDEDQGVPVEWRVFSYMGRVFYSCPKRHVEDLGHFPSPPETAMAGARSWDFGFYDIALTTGGDWKVLKEGDGEFAKVPDGGSASEFYANLEAEMRRGQDIPEWSWCLVGNIVESHPFGPDKRTVYGTKHFRPGTKVYIVDAFWGGGGDRCTVLGVPRYVDHLIGVHMDTTLIRNFRCEKVYDRDVLKAMFTNRLTEEFERERKTNVNTTYWDDSEWSRKRIEDFAESANKIMAEGGEF